MAFALYSSLRSVCVEKSPEPTESIRTMKFSRGTGRAASMQATTSPRNSVTSRQSAFSSHPSRMSILTLLQRPSPKGNLGFGPKGGSRS